VDVTNGKLTLSLKRSNTVDEKTSKKKKKKKKKKSAIGRTYQLSVTNCTDVALEVESKHCFWF
jgi:predicted RNA-binding protein with RPS1 domain